MEEEVSEKKQAMIRSASLPDRAPRRGWVAIRKGASAFLCLARLHELHARRVEGKVRRFLGLAPLSRSEAPLLTRPKFGIPPP